MTASYGRTDSQVGLLAAVWRYRWLTVGLAVLGGALAVAVSLSSADVHSAKAAIALTDPRGNSVFRQGSSANLDLNRYTAERAAFAESEQVLLRAAQAVGGGATAESVNDQVTVTPDPNTSILKVVADADTSKEAIALADAVSQSYQALSADETKAKADLALKGLEAQRAAAAAVLSNPQSSAAEVSSGTQTLSAVNARAADIQSAAELFGNGVTFYDPARAVKPSGTTALVKNAAAGALIGLVIAAALSWLLADRRRRAEADLDLVAQRVPPTARPKSSFGFGADPTDESTELPPGPPGAGVADLPAMRRSSETLL